jgi:phi LC3 family holin
MNKINWKVRFKNPVFIVQILAAVFLPMLAYFGYKWEDMTSWGAILNVLMGAVKNPVILVAVVVSVWNAINDPTTKGLNDSEQARGYIKPR